MKPCRPIWRCAECRATGSAQTVDDARRDLLDHFAAEHDRDRE